MADKIYTVYMFMRKDVKFFVNFTEGEVYEEFKKHLRGEVKFTKDFLPVLVVYIQKFNKLEDAEKRVKTIKKMNRNRKMDLIKKGINTFIPEVKMADEVQILLHRKHGINGIRYIKNENPQLDYTVCLNPSCPEHCNNNFLILNKSSVEELPDNGKLIKNEKGLAGVIKYYRKVAENLDSALEINDDLIEK